MDRFDSITAFTKVVETGSFARAASRLGISVSAVSRHVSELEAHLGVRLLNRTTRKLSMTEGGQAFHERCVQLLADLDEAEQAVTAAAVVPSGTLRITSSISFGVGYLAPAIAEFRHRHPQLRFDIELSDRAVDLVDARIDLAIRIGGAQMVCCASPDYLARNPAPQTPADLARHTCLTYEYSADGNVWRFADAAQRAYDVTVAGVAHANNGAMLAALAVAGLGITLEPDFIVAADVRAGRLVPLLADYAPAAISINAVYPSRRHLSAKVRSFIDFLVVHFEREPAWRIAPATAPKRAGRRPAR
jgi:DNA-binding transcriptional LysR family regulator